MGFRVWGLGFKVPSGPKPYSNASPEVRTGLSGSDLFFFLCFFFFFGGGGLGAFGRSTGDYQSSTIVGIYSTLYCFRVCGKTNFLDKHVGRTIGLLQKHPCAQVQRRAAERAKACLGRGGDLLGACDSGCRGLFYVILCSVQRYA